MPHASPSKHILLFGATGTIGSAVLAELLVQNHEPICVLRKGSTSELPDGVQTIEADVTDADDLRAVFQNGTFDAVISCMASRTGAPADAWAIDHHANSLALTGAKFAGVKQFILLSAICMQKPRLAFQHAKLAFEKELIDSGLTYSIVRPTAYFKSLSGQIKRVQAGKPFLVFGDGKLTACKPISNGDLARYIVSCLDDPEKQNQILPIGGPGPAITPLDQAAMLSELLGKRVKIRRVPITLMNAIIGGLSAAGWFRAKMRDKAEFARTGHYYATESMLVWDADTGQYDAGKTPKFGTEALREHYAQILSGKVVTDLGEHRVF
ncbi:MAG: NAD(P)H-binding protein [Pseudomonadota bacterium]